MQTPHRPLPLGSILLVGVFVPAIFVGIDHALLAGVRNGNAPIPVVFAVYVGEVAALGILAGRFLQPVLLRWLLYGWGWMLFDLHAELSVLEMNRTRDVVLLADSLIAAQCGLVLIWAILGRWPYWAFRYPAALVLAAFLVLFVSPQSWYGFLIQSLVLVVLCGVMIWQGFRLTSESDPIGPIGEVAARSRVQFGVRHVLIWTTTVAVILGLLRGFDMLSLHSLRSLFGHSWHIWLTTCIAAGIVAIVLIAAMWAGLGEGEAWLRWPTPLVVGLMGATVLILIRWTIPTPSRRRGYWYAHDGFDRLLQQGWISVALWLCLAGGLLFAGLLFFRAQGVRLSRDRLPTRCVLEWIREARNRATPAAVTQQVPNSRTLS